MKKVLKDFNNELKTIMNNKKLNYNELEINIKSYINKYNKNRNLIKLKLKKDIINKYGYTKCICTTDRFPKTITKDKEYCVVCAENLSKCSDVYLFDDNNELVSISNKWIVHENREAVRVITSKNKINRWELNRLEYSVEYFKNNICNDFEGKYIYFE